MKIAIIGGGAAGMMAAATIAEQNPNAEIFLIEKNTRLGRKVVLSGGGRCNLTTSTTTPKELLKNYPRGTKWLRYAMHQFGPQETYKWFEDHGIPLKTEEKRVFPKSNKGTNVVYAFTSLFTQKNVKIFFGITVEKITKYIPKKNTKNTSKNTNKKDKIPNFKLTLSTNSSLEVDKVIITTGGNAYSETGSTGDGYEFAKQLGHTIIPLAPSLTSFITEEKWTHELAGVSLPHTKLKIIPKNKITTNSSSTTSPTKVTNNPSNKTKYEFEGPVLFTHTGITGPAIFAISSLSAYENCPLTLSLDLIPQKNYDTLKDEIEKSPIPIKTPHTEKAYPTKSTTTISKSISKYIPKSLTQKLLENLQVPNNKPIPEICKKDINRIIESLKNLQITLISRTPGNEIVTAGGVSLKEINEKTMESKICPNLYFAGEILDIDGFTGGYNLQNAWTTGKVAGDNACG